MISFGTGGWRAIIGDGFTKLNVQRLARALALRMKAEDVQDKSFTLARAVRRPSTITPFSRRRASSDVT